MGQDLGKLAGRVDEARLGTAIGENIPAPQFKPFVPSVSPDSPEALNYYREYGIDPHDLGDSIRQGILESQKHGGPFNSDLYKRPVANLGAQGFDSTRIVPLPFDLSGIGGGYQPTNARLNPDYDAPIYDTIKILGDNQRLIDDFIFTTPRGGGGTLKHELTHRAFRKLESIMTESKGRVPPRFSLFKKVDFWNEDKFRTKNVRLSEEDVTKLLDYAAGDHRKVAEDYFGGFGKWENVKTSPDELLKSPEILELLMTIQQMAAEELKKQDIDTPVHFPATK